MSVASAILKYSPSSYWKLDETSGTFADQVGGVTGTAVNSPAYSQPPVTRHGGTSIRFDNADGDRISFGDVYNFTGTAQFTALCWLQPRAYNAGSGHSLWSIENVAANGWSLTLVNPAVTFRMSRGDAAGFNTVDYTMTQATYEDNSPKMVAMRYDGTNLILNINGVDVKTGASSKSVTDAGVSLNFGAFNAGGSGYDGWADDLAIYSTCLTVENLADIFAANRVLSSPYLDFDFSR